MEGMKRIGWILVGVVTGALATGSMTAVRQLPESPQRRLTIFTQTSIAGSRTAYLIKDAKGEGCWLMITSNNPDGPVALAAAPAPACYER
jgi:hypothetical protein